MHKITIRFIGEKESICLIFCFYTANNENKTESVFVFDSSVSSDARFNLGTI